MIFIKFVIMTTLTIDVLNDKSLNLLKDLEMLKIIRVRNNKQVADTNSDDLVSKYKGAMAIQTLNDVDKQLSDLRN
jgi:hypothetical protein